MPTVPPVAVTTLKEAKYYLEVCEAWEQAGKEGFHTKEEVAEKYVDITQEDACRWALYGWPAESQIDFEKLLTTWSGYTVKLRTRVSFLVDQLISRQRAIDEFNKRGRHNE